MQSKTDSYLAEGTTHTQKSKTKQHRDKTDRIKEVDRDQHQTILEAFRK